MATYLSCLFWLLYWKLHKVWLDRLWQLPSRDALMLFKYWASGYKLQFETKMWDLCIANHAIMSLLFQLKNLNLIYLNTWHSGREKGITSLSLCEILLLRFCFKFDSDFYLTLNFLPIWQNGHWGSKLTHTFVSICASSTITQILSNKVLGPRYSRLIYETEYEILAGLCHWVSLYFMNVFFEQHIV